MRVSMVLILLAALAAPVPLDADDELWIAVAGRGRGGSGSMWVTDLYVMNTGEEAIEVEISFLDRFVDNREVEGTIFEVEGGQTLSLPDVIATTFGSDSAFGAIHIEAVDEDDDEGNDLGDDGVSLMAHARIYDNGSGGTVGQAVEGMASDAAISADGDATAFIPGIAHNGSFRSNWFGLNVTETDEEGSGEAEVLVELLDLDGEVIASRTYAMPPLAPLFFSLSDLAPTFDDGTLRLTMLEGEAIFGASKIDSRTNDPTTLSAKGRSPGREEKLFTDDFFIEDCTFTATGRNPFFPLTPGHKIVLEGEDDGELVRNTIEVLNETFVVDGVTTRVVTETETADGELTEISRNYFAECVETGSVFYFGEHVDIYEDGEIVSHDGEWLAGENGARAGIMMPGAIVAGSRYFQEVAPEVALDRAEHLATGLTIETPAGTFDRCMSVRDSSALDPRGQGDIKVYCYGAGNVIDADLELVELVRP